MARRSLVVAAALLLLAVAVVQVRAQVDLQVQQEADGQEGAMQLKEVEEYYSPLSDSSSEGPDALVEVEGTSQAQTAASMFAAWNHMPSPPLQTCSIEEQHLLASHTPDFMTQEQAAQAQPDLSPKGELERIGAYSPMPEDAPAMLETDTEAEADSEDAAETDAEADVDAEADAETDAESDDAAMVQTDESVARRGWRRRWRAPRRHVWRPAPVRHHHHRVHHVHRPHRHHRRAHRVHHHRVRHHHRRHRHRRWFGRRRRHRRRHHRVHRHVHRPVHRVHHVHRRRHVQPAAPPPPSWPHPFPRPSPNMNGKVQYTVSYELYIPHVRGHWANIFSRGASDGDRTPGMWTYPGGSRIHFRHASTRSWNDGVDSVASGPIARWFKVKCVIDHNKAWIFIDGKFDQYVDLGPSHHFTWGQKSLQFKTAGAVNPGYANTMQMRKFKWRDYAEPLPAWIPQPNFESRVKYTVSFDVFIDRVVPQFRCFFNRGQDNSDRTPGVWSYPSSTRIHFRHAHTRDWNGDVDASWAPPVGKWFSFKASVDHNKAWITINGMLDRVVELPAGTHFVWGKKSLGFASGPSVHASYAPGQMRNFKWRNTVPRFPAPMPNFNKPVEFSLSFKAFIPPPTTPFAHWPALFVRGRDNSDRAPGLWYMATAAVKGIHVRLGSTMTWNHDIDATTPAPIGKWFRFKLVVKHNQAWVYQDGKLDRFVDLPAGHHFRWNTHSLSFARGATVHAAHHNDGANRIKMRKFRWSNTAESLPLALPKPNFSAPVQYTMKMQAFIPKLQPNWACLSNRGRDNGDRTPGIWTWPGSSRIHVRHASTRSSNDDCDTVSSAPVGQWFSLKTVFTPHTCKVYLNGRLDREVNLGPNHRFLWGQKSLGWAHGGAVHPSYHDVRTRRVQFFSPHSVPVVRVRPLRSPDAAFWGHTRRPKDQHRPKPLPKYVPPPSVKPPPAIKPAVVPFIAPPKVVKPSAAPVLPPTAKPKPPVPAKKPPPFVKPVHHAKPRTSAKPVFVDPMNGKVLPKGKVEPPKHIAHPLKPHDMKPKPVVQVVPPKPNVPAPAPQAKVAAPVPPPQGQSATQPPAPTQAPTQAPVQAPVQSGEPNMKPLEKELVVDEKLIKENAELKAQLASKKAAAELEKSRLAALIKLRRERLAREAKEDAAEDARREKRRQRRLAALRRNSPKAKARRAALKAKKAAAKAVEKSAEKKQLDTDHTVGSANQAYGATFKNGFWIGQYAPKHTNEKRQLCPDCQPIIYNSDSPLSDDDIKLMRAQHEDFVTDHVPLLGQATLDQATLAIDDADLNKKKLLDRYPVRQDGGAGGYDEGGEAEE